jgi:hypothetical protein
MISYAMDIKNLSIAIEALSRVQMSYSLSSDIEELLKSAIKKQRELDQEPATPSSTPTKPTNPDDDIPF